MEKIHQGEVTNLEIIEFIQLKPSQNQIDRLEEINKLGIPNGFNFVNYVKTGVLPIESSNKNHPLYEVYLVNELNRLNQEDKSIREDTSFNSAIAAMELMQLSEFNVKSLKNEQA